MLTRKHWIISIVCYTASQSPKCAFLIKIIYHSLYRLIFYINHNSYYDYYKKLNEKQYSSSFLFFFSYSTKQNRWPQPANQPHFCVHLLSHISPFMRHFTLQIYVPLYFIACFIKRKWWIRRPFIITRCVCAHTYINSIYKSLHSFIGGPRSKCLVYKSGVIN